MTSRSSGPHRGQVSSPAGDEPLPVYRSGGPADPRDRSTPAACRSPVSCAVARCRPRPPSSRRPCADREVLRTPAIGPPRQQAVPRGAARRAVPSPAATPGSVLGVVLRVGLLLGVVGGEGAQLVV